MLKRTLLALPIMAALSSTAAAGFSYKGEPWSVRNDCGFKIVELANSGNSSERNNRLYLGNSRAKPVFWLMLTDVEPGDVIEAEGDGEATVDRLDYTAVGTWLEIEYESFSGSKTAEVSERNGQNYHQTVQHHAKLSSNGSIIVPEDIIPGTDVKVKWMWVANASKHGGGVPPHYIFAGAGDVTGTSDRKDYGRLKAKLLKPEPCT